MAPRIDFAGFDERAMQSTRRRLQPLTTTDLERPSGCTGWDIRALLSHLVGGTCASPRRCAASRPTGRRGTSSRSPRRSASSTSLRVR